MRKALLTTATAFLAILGMAAPALACGGLVNPNGTVSLLRTSTLAAYVDGIEHYITSFDFAGGGAEFGSIIPLPGVPTKVERAGDWTLQRLQEEVAPVVFNAARATAGEAVALDSAEVLLEAKIDALDITILKGGGDEVGRWAKENGFVLTPDAPAILDHYAARSPIFMAARFDIERAENLDQQLGQGTPIHLTIPTDHPWVPLRILGLGRRGGEPIEADVFLLTEEEPILVPAGGGPGLKVERSEPASDDLLTDLVSDKGMEWLPAQDMWFTYLPVDSTAGELTYDLDAYVGDVKTAIQEGNESGFDGWVLALASLVPLAAWGGVGISARLAKEED